MAVGPVWELDAGSSSLPTRTTEKRLFSQENAVFLNFLAQIKCHAEHLTTYRLLALFWYFENNHRTNVANIVEV